MNIAESIEKKFVKIFSKKPVVIKSPGRVNLIGEHTDYNEGFVLPAAIDKNIFLSVSSRDDKQCHIYSFDLDEKFVCNIDSFEKCSLGWANYLLGVVDQFKRRGFDLGGFNCVFGGDIPIGAGLSSSAAIETGLAFALNHIYKLKISKLDLVKIAQAAENEFVGVKCGIMDQFANIYSRSGNVIKLDCRSLDYSYIKFDKKEIRIVLCDTQIKHSLASTEYNLRRQQCSDGVTILKKYQPSIKSLRDVDLEILYKYKSEFPEIIFKRCNYVIQENKRVLDACEDLECGDLKSFGQRMYQSHRGLKDDYNVSCKELDFLVDLTNEADGVYGARMMGGGFGGCTINLVHQEYVEKFCSIVSRRYQEKINFEPKIYITNIGEGTIIVS